MNCCRIYEDDSKAHYKAVTEKRGRQQQNHGKPYNAPNDKGRQRVTDGRRTSGGGAPANVVCYRCGKPGHRSNACTGEVKRCFRYGKVGHEVADCRHKAVMSFNYGEEGHISTQCQKPKKAQNGGKVLA